MVVNFHALDRLPALKGGLRPGGFLLYEHFSTVPEGDSGPPARYRFGPNELLRACLDLRIVRYEEPIDPSDDDRVTLVAQKSREEDA